MSEEGAGAGLTDRSGVHARLRHRGGAFFSPSNSTESLPINLSVSQA